MKPPEELLQFLLQTAFRSAINDTPRYRPCIEACGAVGSIGSRPSRSGQRCSASPTGVRRGKRCQCCAKQMTTDAAPRNHSAYGQQLTVLRVGSACQSAAAIAAATSAGAHSSPADDSCCSGACPVAFLAPSVLASHSDAWCTSVCLAQGKP